VNAARYFQRREDYQPPQTPADSPFRKFKVRCLACGSYRLRLAAQFQEETGETVAILICTRCRQSETLPLK
jgi:hypothetical protein